MANTPKVWNGSAWIDIELVSSPVAASTSVPGIVQLTDSTSSTSTTTAAVPNSVKTSYDLATTKAKVSVGTATPSTPATGDIWVDTAGTATAINAVPLAALTGTGAMIYGGGVGTAATLAIGTAGQVLSVASGLPSWTTLAAAGADVQEFTSSGSWVKPSGKSAVYVFAVGAGGGGGSGARGAATTAGGGTGGNGGIAIQKWLLASALAGTVTITVGSGGAGGTAIAAGATTNVGVVGAAGGETSFGTVVVSPGGYGGYGGENSGSQNTIKAQGVAESGRGTDNSSSAAGTTDVPFSYPSAGQGGDLTAMPAQGGIGAPTERNAMRTYMRPAGGGGGGVAYSAAFTYGGGAGARGFGLAGTIPSGGAGGSAVAGAAGTAGSVNGGIGISGGGGGAAYNGAGGQGGAGYVGGGGGGGGGVYRDSGNHATGAGGAGGNGYMLVISV